MHEYRSAKPCARLSRYQAGYMTRPANLAIALYALLILYGAARLLELRSGGVASLTLVALEVLCGALFALLHGARTFGRRGILVFLGLAVVIGSFFESLSLRTGFPFGHYYFTAVMGPQLFHLPVLLVLAYLGMGYASLVLGLLILGKARTDSRVVTLPVLSSFILVAWDLAMDPLWANVARAWVWEEGGPYFGVPVSNFLGWYLTVCCIYLLFALYLGDREIAPQAAEHWRFPILFYAITAFGNLFFALPAFGASRRPRVLLDQVGRAWVVRDILSACVLISLFLMIPFAFLAWVRVKDQK